MAYIECPDCGEGVSSTADYCPNCNRPISAMTVRDVEEGFKWKKMKWIGVCMMVVGVSLFFIDAQSDEIGGVGALVGLIGFALLWVAKAIGQA